MNYKVHPAENPKNIFDRVVKKLHREVIINPQRNQLRKAFIKKLPCWNNINASDLHIHMLLCKRDIEMAVCTCKMLNHVSGINFKYIIHDDGTLNAKNAKFIESNIHVQIIFKTQADKKAVEQLQSFPHIIAYRNSHPMAMKLIDVKLFSTGKRIGYVDSDILFFRKPGFYIDQLFAQEQQKNYFNKDLINAYIDETENIFHHTGIRPFEKINAGLWVMNSDDINFEKIETMLNTEYIRQFGYTYLLEQTLISMLANNSAAGVSYFPAEYDVDFYKKPQDSVCKHYVGKIRQAYELEGLKYVLNEKLYA